GERCSVDEREATFFTEHAEGTEREDRSFSPALPDTLALPPPSPDWSHHLCRRSHEAASALSARSALLGECCPATTACAVIFCNMCKALDNRGPEPLNTPRVRLFYENTPTAYPCRVGDRLWFAGDCATKRIDTKREHS